MEKKKYYVVVGVILTMLWYAVGSQIYYIITYPYKNYYAESVNHCGYFIFTGYIIMILIVMFIGLVSSIEYVKYIRQDLKQSKEENKYGKLT
jgi:hypothetical protein